MKLLILKWQTLALFVSLILAICFLKTTSAEDPTLYQHYTSGGVKTGLNASSVAFTLNGKPFTIFGGSFHYFRVVPQYWRQTLLRMKAAGLNSVMMYFPWNIHEPQQGHFDFTSEAVNIARFLEEIKLADMFAIVRIGPYFCGEFELGGMPGWLLKDPAMKFRTNYKPFTDLAKIYLEHLMAIVNRFQFSKNGGPVIMLQLENEYFGPAIPHSPEYLRFLHDLVVNSGFKELLFTSDPGHVAAKMPIKSIFPKNDVLETANFNTDSDAQLTALAKAQPGRPLFVSEFWPGWFDFWGAKEAHHRYTTDKFDHEMNDILFKHNASVSIYMFIGGTNFGFYNGANDKRSAFESALHVVTSYDYDAPLSESGNYTAKYHKTRELYQKLVSTGRLPKTRLPEVPKVQPVKAYGSVKVERQLPLEEMLKITKRFALKQAVTMEMLPEPQSLGFILYRVVGKGVKVFEVTEAIFDRSLFLENGKEGAEVPYGSRFIEAKPGRKATEVTTFDMLVENQGRINYGVHMESERKGINSNITLDDHVVHNLTAYSLDFNATFLAELPKLHWTAFNHTKLLFSPAMYEAKLKVEGRPEDTFLKMDGWTKGNVFVNGFNLGRYWKVGPTKTMYLPAPLLKTGENTIQVFELHIPGDQLHFVDQPVLG